MHYSTKGWLGLFVYLGVVEYFAPRDDMLSDGMDRWRAHPVGKYIATAGILLTASHLLRSIPSTFDPFTLAFRWKMSSTQSMESLQV